jgi:hypothetical protein
MLSRFLQKKQKTNEIREHFLEPPEYKKKCIPIYSMSMSCCSRARLAYQASATSLRITPNV